MIKKLLRHEIWRKIFTPIRFKREQERIAYLKQVKVEVDQFFNRLPRCTAKLVLVSPAYYRDQLIQERHRFLPDSIQDGEVRGEIVVLSLELAQFLAKRRIGSYSLNDFGIWLAAFLEWLKNADLANQNPLFLPKKITSGLLWGYLPNIFNECPLDVYCWDCRKNYSGLIKHTNRSKLTKGWNFIEDFWYCDSGHMMYKFIEEMHVLGYFPREKDSTESD